MSATSSPRNMLSAKRNARAEAATTLGPGWRPQVLEPSPPADQSNYLADDPLAEPPGEGTVVSPLGVLPSALSSASNGENGHADIMTWTHLVSRQPDLAQFASERWLASWRRLEQLPVSFVPSRLALHRVAVYIVSAARRMANGKIGLRYTKGGFGTPFFVEMGDVERTSAQVRIDGADLVYQRGDDVVSAGLTTLNQAAQAIGMPFDAQWAADYDVPPPGDPDADLAIDPATVACMADWFGFGFSVLEELRADEASIDASRPQLWPEHFDPSIEIGSEDARQRASFGFSPGDASPDGQPEPYLYVSAWFPDHLNGNPFWNAEGFDGAVLSYQELLDTDDQRHRALDFFRTARYFLLDNEG